MRYQKTIGTLGFAWLWATAWVPWPAAAQDPPALQAPDPLQAPSPRASEPAQATTSATPYPPVRWICNDVDAAKPTLETLFEPGAVTVTWQGDTVRLDHVPSEVGAAYVGWNNNGGKSLRVRPDDRAVLTSGNQVVGCRARRRGRKPMPTAGPSATELATTLVMGVPTKRLELFSVVGPIEPDPDDPMPGVGLQWQFRDEGPISSVSLDTVFDPYHGNPDAPNPELKEWSVTFRGDPRPVRELLRSQYGEPRELIRIRPAGPLKNQTVWRHGRFYLTARSSSYEITYRKWEPEWVVPPLDKSTAQREIARVERILRGGIRRANIEAEFGPLGPDQWGESLEAWTTHWRVDVTPAQGPLRRIFITPRARPIPAGSLIRTLGIEHPVVVSRDVHMSSRDLEDRGKGPLRMGDWKVEIHIDRDDLEGLKTDRHPPTWTSETFPIRGVTLRR